MTKVSGMPICLCGLRADEHIGKRCKKKIKPFFTDKELDYFLAPQNKEKKLEQHSKE